MRIIRPEKSVYRIEKLQGEGRTARVYRAIREDSRGHSQLTVALKVLKDENLVPWLRREFKTLAKVDSSHCVRVLGWENLSEGSALVLEWVEGVNLLELARATHFDEEMIHELIAQVQVGLTDLNSSGLHHGDLSPVNILIDREGRVRVVDFAAIGAEPGVVHGTPLYLAPEIWCGERANYFSDLFALGAIEVDLRTSFSRHDRSRCLALNLNHESEGALGLARSRILIDEHGDGNPLLKLDPLERRQRHWRPTHVGQSKLARAVKDLMDHRSQLRMETAISAYPCKAIGPQIRSFKRLAGLLALFCAAATTPVSAQAPISAEGQACVEFRSQQWMKVDLNGHDLGYTPILVHALPLGRHKVRWSSARRAGERYIELRQGSCAIVNLANL